MADKVRNHAFGFEAGALCLDFANTVGDRPLAEEEHLKGYPDLLSWGRQAGILDAGSAAHLAREAAAHPARAQRAFERALELRESCYRIFSALAKDTRPPAPDLALLNA